LEPPGVKISQDWAAACGRFLLANILAPIDQDRCELLHNASDYFKGAVERGGCLHRLLFCGGHSTSILADAPFNSRHDKPIDVPMLEMK
jgi:hypothetical protein